MSLVIDEATASRHKQHEAVEKTRQLTWDGFRNRHRGEKLVEGEKSISNPKYQEGNKLTKTQFENRLRKLNKDVVILPHPNPLKVPYFKTKACLYVNMPDGTQGQLFPCEGDWMPEWDIWGEMVIKTPLGELRKMPYMCVKRGWRTVLIRLISMKLITLEAAEKEFGRGTRFSWQIMTGKTSGTLPI